jgi:hypothetical protein
MTRLEKWARRFYSLLMGLYPAAFRKEFGDEMQYVFEEKLAEEKKAGSAHLLLVIFQELHDLAIQAIPERIKEWKGAQRTMRFIHFMFTPSRGARAVSILSPILLIVFLSVFNPRYIFHFFSDPLGWGILVAVLLGLFLGWMNWRLPLPKASLKVFWEELGMVSLIFFLDMLILLGSAVIILSQMSISATGSLAQFVAVVRWIILGIDSILLGAAVYFGLKQFRKPCENFI